MLIFFMKIETQAILLITYCCSIIFLYKITDAIIIIVFNHIHNYYWFTYKVGLGHRPGMRVFSVSKRISILLDNSDDTKSVGGWGHFFPVPFLFIKNRLICLFINLIFLSYYFTSASKSAPHSTMRAYWKWTGVQCVCLG